MTRYIEAFKRHGLKVHRFKSFQNEWLAQIEHKKRRGWVHGWAGCCNQCDYYLLGDDSPETRELKRWARDFDFFMVGAEHIIKELKTKASYNPNAQAMLRFIAE